MVANNNWSGGMKRIPNTIEHCQNVYILSLAQSAGGGREFAHGVDVFDPMHRFYSNPG